MMQDLPISNDAVAAQVFQPSWPRWPLVTFAIAGFAGALLQILWPTSERGPEWLFVIGSLSSAAILVDLLATRYVVDADGLHIRSLFGARTLAPPGVGSVESTEVCRRWRDAALGPGERLEVRTVDGRRFAIVAPDDPGAFKRAVERLIDAR